MSKLGRRGRQAKRRRTAGAGLSPAWWDRDFRNREVRVNHGAIMAAATYIVLPMLLVFFAFQRYFPRGITIGGVKG